MDDAIDSSVQVGQVLAAKYRVDRILGAGGMGVVMAATHLQLDQLVALKFIRREAMNNPEVVSRFEREARIAVRLRSEHVARVIDVGRLESGSPYIVMEYLEGQDLSSLLAQQGALPVQLACDFLVQACDAVAEAHALGIVHRDLKPGNLFLANTAHGQRTIKILDFGISKAGIMGDPSMTRTHVIMGSPGYMSPEQMRSAKNVDGRSDLWSLGVILYELVAGRVPFQADTFSALCLKVAIDLHPPLPALPAAVPRGFEVVVNRALEKDPERRYQSALELAEALAPFASPGHRDRVHELVSLAAGRAAGGAHLLPTVAAPVVPPTTLRAASGQALAGAAGAGGRPRRWLLASAAACVVAVAGMGVAVLWPADSGPRGEPAGGSQISARRPLEVLPAAPPRRAPDPPVRDAGIPDSATPVAADPPPDAAVLKPTEHGHNRPPPDAYSPYSSPE